EKACGYPPFFLDSAMYRAISTSRGKIPKLASAQNTNSTLWRANQSTSLWSLSRSHALTLLATAEPQSQKVHEKGQPRLVSHIAIQCSWGLTCIKRSNTPSK